MRGRRGGGDGALIVVAGPDGTGKSTLVDGLVVALGSSGWEVRRYHHVFRILPPSRAARRLTTEPHAQRAYPRWLSRMKVVYLFVNQLLGWWVHVRGFVRRGGVAILERGWWDLVVDPRRYRLASAGPAARLARLLPKPDRTIVLVAPSAVILARSGELPRPELERQLAAWQAIAARDPRVTVLDASQDAATLLATAIAVAPGAVRPDLTRDEVAVPLGSPSRWVDLPPIGRARWTVPDRPRRVASGALLVHQPMRGWARIAWLAARRAAGVGAFRILPGAAAPALLDELREFVPVGGTLAVARLPRDGRLIGLILDRQGAPHALAKVFRDPDGREKLRREAAALERFAPFAHPPLFAPAILAVRDDLLVLEAAAWRPRSRPWALEPQLAAALGRFHRSSPMPDGGGLTHGDFAPWNVLPVADGWFLVDWEDATSSGPTFQDPLHYLVQGTAFLGRPGIGLLLAGLRGDGPVGEALDAYASAAGTTLADASPALRRYLAARPADSSHRARSTVAALTAALDPALAGGAPSEPPGSAPDPR